MLTFVEVDSKLLDNKFNIYQCGAEVSLVKDYYSVAVRVYGDKSQQL